jgi:hypothetical protein
MSDQEWLSVSQAAARAGVGAARIRQLVQHRQVEFARSTPDSRDTRIRAASLAAWMRGRTRGRPPTTAPPAVECAPGCICCGAALPTRRRGRPRLHCTDCIIAGCSPRHGALHRTQEISQ